MRWQQLFADLEARFEAEQEAAERAEASSRARHEVGALRLVDRLRGALGSPVVLLCRGAGQVSGTLSEVGTDWLLLDDGGREVLVATGPVRAISGLGRRTASPQQDGAVARRLDLRRALRGLARDRAAVQLVLDEGSVLHGAIDRVGADYLELAEHPADLHRRAEVVQGVRTVVLPAVVVVRVAQPGLGGRGSAEARAGYSASAFSAGIVVPRASAYFCWMKRSSSSTSTRHCPRPPIWIARSSLRRTSA